MHLLLKGNFDLLILLSYLMNGADFYKRRWVLVRLPEVSVDFRVLKLDFTYFFSFEMSKVWAPTQCTVIVAVVTYRMIIVGTNFSTSIDIFYRSIFPVSYCYIFYDALLNFGAFASVKMSLAWFAFVYCSCAYIFPFSYVD